VLRLTAQGFSNKEIAWQIEVSVKTVETYKSRSRETLSANARSDCSLREFARLAQRRRGALRFEPVARSGNARGAAQDLWPIANARGEADVGLPLTARIWRFVRCSSS
jgi:DNA-binding NarL/FixJ family response regulator